MDHEKRFGEGPDSGDAGQSVPASLMDPDWCGLAWTPWAALEREVIRQIAPTVPGVYRVRRQGDGPGRLTYIGQTGHGLRERLLALAAGVNAEDCPFNDPHTAAPHLWLLRRLDGAQLEFCCAPVPGTVQILRGTEDMLLWRHRIETGLHGSQLRPLLSRLCPLHQPLDCPEKDWGQWPNARPDSSAVPGRQRSA